MTSPRVFKLDEFLNGKRTLAYTESAGVTTHQAKDEVVDIPFGVGSLVLLDDRGTIVGPLTVEGARSLAERILEDDQRAKTDPRALLTLATAVFGWLVEPDYSEPMAAAVATEVSHV